MGDLVDFLVPDLGEGLEEATVITWLVVEGDTVTLNQPLCLVETAKAEVEVPSPHAGVVAALGGAEGDTLAVGSLLVRIDRGEAPARQPTLVGYGHDETMDRSRRGRWTSTRPVGAPPKTPAAGATRPLAKPPVRMLARRLGVDLAALAPGSGPGGIVTRADVERSAAAAAKAVRSSTRPTSVVGPKAGETVPVRGIRARIAQRMTESRVLIPDATCSVVADCERLLELRGLLNDALVRRGAEPVLTPFSLMCGLLVHAVRENPTLNSTYIEDGPQIHLHDQIHLGIGTATERGLLVSVIRDAGHMTFVELATELARLSAVARDGSITPQELQGSTMTVSNFGALGLDEGIPVINHPEAAILGIGSVRQRPHVVDGEVVARHTAHITLVFDHRVADGVEAASLLGSFRDLIERPELTLV
jgi:pyruvate dehydrogenase E2 component (dihydrolipoamide acetyltransferase)